jgi:hypothetical protein
MRAVLRLKFLRRRQSRKVRQSLPDQNRFPQALQCVPKSILNKGLFSPGGFLLNE